MPKILYVEDNDDNLYMLTLRFEAHGGYEIVSAGDGAEGGGGEPFGEERIVVVEGERPWPIRELGEIGDGIRGANDDTGVSEEGLDI